MTNWDDEADVVILGFGCAGIAAAIAAAKKGASVRVLEKQGADEHTPNFRMSGGLVMTVTEAEAGARYLSRCAGGLVGEAEITALARRATGLKAWLERSCPATVFSLVNKSEHPDFEGAEAIEVYQQGVPRFKQDPAAGNGASLYAELRRRAEELGARVEWDMPARHLVRDGSGRVTGVVAGKNGERRVAARGGIVLATGGFEYDEAAKLAYLRATPMHFYGNKGNTGDGLRMAQEVGADLWHMGQIVGRGVGNFQLDDGTDQAFLIAVAPAPYVILDGEGRRFADEHDQAMLKHAFYYDLVHLDTDRGIYPRIPSYWIFDEKRRRKGPLTLTNVGACSVGLYEWSSDNSREIERGWVKRGDTVAAAAAAAGLDRPVEVAESIQAYNEGCRKGMDAFGRPADTLVPIDTPPFYCVKLWPGGSNTTGGPRRDASARVIDVHGQPIEGLYCAGELGQVSGLLYAADGANLCEAMCFGQIAAENALARAVAG